MGGKRKKSTLPLHHPYPPVPQVLLRKVDIEEMVRDGTIKDQHFLIKLLAEEIAKQEAAKDEGN